MAIRTAVPTLSDLVVTSGRGGGQTVVGGTQSGAELTLASSPNSDGLIQIGSGFFLDESGTVKKLGVFTFAPQNQLDLPSDARFRGGGTGQMTLVNDVLQVVPAGGGGGGFFTRDTAQPAGFPAVLVPATNTDSLNVGPEAANFDAQMIVNIPAGYPGTLGFTVVSGDSALSRGNLLLMVTPGGSVGVGTQTPPQSGEGAAQVCRIAGMPLAMSGGGWELEGGVAPPALATTPGVALRLKSAGTIFYLPGFAAAGGVGGATVTDNFQGTDATSLASHTSDSGHIWTLVRGAWALRGTNTGYANNSGSSNALGLCWISGQGADGTVQCGMTTQSPLAYPYGSIQNGLCFRYDATSDKCVVLIATDISHYQLREFDGTTPGTVFATLNVAPSVGDLLKVTMLGNVWNVWVASGTSGSFIQYVTNLTIAQSWTSTNHHGLCNTWNNAFNQPEWFQYSYVP